MAQQSAGMQEFDRVCNIPHAEQAQYFLSAFWDECEHEKEAMWDYVQLLIELDPQGAEGVKVDELKAHRFLERFGQTMTVIEMRDALREIDVNSDQCMSLVEFLIYKYGKSVEDLIQIMSGELSPELIAAQEAMRAVQAEITAIANKKANFQKVIDTGTVFQKSKARLELAQLEAADQTDLNRRIITAEAAVRRLSGAGGPVPVKGNVWWMQREIVEAKKYLPQSQQ